MSSTYPTISAGSSSIPWRAFVKRADDINVSERSLSVQSVSSFIQIWPFSVSLRARSCSSASSATIARISSTEARPLIDTLLRLPNRFEGRAVCADIVDETDRDDCLADVESGAEEEGEECSDVFDARLELCADLSDAAHEPAFGAAFAASFVDPAAIGSTVRPHAFLPLVAGGETPKTSWKS